MSYYQVVTFDLCGEAYAVDISNVNGIVKYKNYSISKIPTAPSELEGIINLRGKVSPIFNLKRKFGLHDASMNSESKIIFINKNEMLIGFAVDEVTDIFKLSEEDIEPFPGCVSLDGSKYIKGIGKVGDQMVLILDLIKAITENEIQSLPSVPEMAKV